MIDLHTHSTASDGVLEPAALVRRAKAGGLSAIALTDHDTTGGVAEAAEEGRRAGIEVVAGVEISVERDPGTCHLIGLFLDVGNPTLESALGVLREGRRARNMKLVARLGELGMPVTIEEVSRIAGGEVVGRPHFTTLLMQKGYVSSPEEAFGRWLGKGKPAYQERLRLTPEVAIEAIHAAGGVAVLCHPFTLGLNGDGELELFVSRLAEMGLDAMEVWCRDRHPSRERKYGRIAERQGLLPSGGTDFHGMSQADRRTGLAARRLSIPVEVLDALRERSA